MINLNDIQRGGCFNLVRAGLAIGDGAKTGPAIVNTITYLIDGVQYTKTGAATVLPLTAAALQPVLTTCLYLIVINAAGTVTSIAGKPVLSSDLTAGTAVLKWPDLPSDVAPVGAVRITLASTATFLPGTTALDATNVTATYLNLFSLPAKPLTA